MQKDKHTLQIVNPCEENWQTMSPTENGAFCNQCQKNVIDFSIMSDEAIIACLENTNGKICGRVRSDQLNRVLEIRKQKKIPSFVKWIAGLLLWGSIKEANAEKQLIPNTNIHSPVFSSDSIEVITTKDTLGTYIEGIVLDKNNEGVFPTTILIQGTTIGTSTDFDGKFILQIPDDFINQFIVLNITSLGYNTLSSKFFITKNGKTSVSFQLFIDYTKIDSPVIIKRTHVLGLIDYNPK